jgi:hypothetical protein
VVANVLTNDYIVKYQYSRMVLPTTPSNSEGERRTEMELGHVAIVWSIARQQESAAPDASRPRRARAGRFVSQLRRIAYRAQLGPASGPAAA